MCQTAELAVPPTIDEIADLICDTEDPGQARTLLFLLRRVIDAPVRRSFRELQECVSDLHAGGDSAATCYVEALKRRRQFAKLAQIETEEEVRAFCEEQRGEEEPWDFCDQLVCLARAHIDRKAAQPLPIQDVIRASDLLKRIAADQLIAA